MEPKEEALELDYSTCEKLIGKVPNKEIAETKAFIEGDHWQKQAGWIGWRPESGSKSAVNTWIFIEQNFTAKNVIGGMIKRLKGAIAGQQPDFAIVPKDRDNASEALNVKLSQWDRAVNAWWTNKNVHSEIRKYVQNRTAHGKACLRIYIPKGLITKVGEKYKLNVSNFEEALEKIYVKAHEPENYIDGCDEDFGEKYSVVRLKADDSPLEENSTNDYDYEICFVDKNKQTILRTLNKEGQKQKISLDLKGKSLIFINGEYTDAIVSPTIKMQQKAVNHAKTGESLALSNINFPETTFIDVELPTEKVLQPSGKYEEKLSLRSGWGVMRKLYSKIVSDAEGGDRPLSGQMIQRQPTDPKYFASVADNNTRDMHQEAGMLYIYLADSEYASGDAKLEAMADYLILLVDYQTEIDTIGRWLLETVILLAARFSNQNGDADKFEVTFSSKLTMGRLTVEERRLMIEEVKARLRSIRSYMVKAKVSDDPDSEITSIQQEIEKYPEIADMEMMQEERRVAMQAKPTAPTDPPDNA